jgi:hypothetical protein
MTFTVDVLSAGGMPLPGPEVFWTSAWDEWFDSRFWLVVARDGTHTVLVNTGPPPDLGPLNTVGKLPLFPNAQYVVSRRGWIEDILAPTHPTSVPREIFLPDDVLAHLLFEARARLRLMTEEEIVPGLRVWEAGVHHRSSLAVCFDTAAGSVVATHAAFAYRNVEENAYLGVGQSYAEAMATYARLRTEADVLVPLFEPAVLERHPGGRIAGPAPAS